MADLQREARTARVQTAVQDERAADAPVPGGHAQQVPRAPAGAVPVFGERGEVDVVARERGPADTGGAHALREDLPDRGARGPGQVQGVEREAGRFGDGGGHGESGADTAPPGAAQQLRARLDHGAEHLRGVGVDGLAAGGGRHDAPAEADQRGPEAVGVDLGRERDRTVLGDLQPVRRPPLGAGRRTGPGVHADQPQRLQLGGDRAGRRPGDAEFGGEHGTGRRPPGVHQLQRRPERPAPAVQPCP